MKKSLLIYLLICQCAFGFAQPEQNGITAFDRDSLWKTDVETGMDSFANLRIALFRFQDENHTKLLTLLDTSALRLVRELDVLYQGEVLEYKNWFTRNCLTGNRKKQGYSYLDMMLKFDAFFFCPDMYAILISSARLNAHPKIDMEKRNEAQALFVSIMDRLNSIGFAKKDEILRLLEKFKKANQVMPHTINQDAGLVTEEDRYGFRVVDMLLCLSRE
ncbi:MAG: hypothetical protein ACKVU2_03930 [Saprospiraceae bacterium]